MNNLSSAFDTLSSAIFFQQQRDEISASGARATMTTCPAGGIMSSDLKLIRQTMGQNE